MQFVSQSLFSALASNKIFQDLEFVNATRLDSPGIVKDIARVIGEYEFVINLVLAPLAPWSISYKQLKESTIVTNID